jgi:hypothetical protein
MRCPHCWSTKAYVRSVTFAKRLLLGCFLLVPMRCRHCYHTFVVPWFSTMRQDVRRPARSRTDPKHHAVRPARTEPRHPLQKPENRI